MRVKPQTVLHIFTGIPLILLGILGLVLPVLNGTVLLIIGLIILSFEYPYIERKLFTITQKNKVIHALYLKLEKIMRRIFRIYK
jgi:uncharacterized protein YqgC (DUF456 family)